MSSTDTKPNKRAHWSSQLTFILALTGAAVGLGNIWKFPYMAGDNGGGAFVLVYILAVIFIGLPVMVAEILIGRRAQKNPVDALSELAVAEGKSRYWSWLGWWGMLGLLITLSFYSVVAGWSIYYFIESVSGGLAHHTPHAIMGVWTHFLASPGKMSLYHLVFMFLTMFVVARGVHKGLELANLFMMPLLFILLTALVIFAIVSTGPAFMQAYHFLFDLRFQQITGAVVINAVGHAFFTLAVGVGAMEVYGSYLSKKTSIGKSVVITAGLDVLTAFLAGLAIFPVLFLNHIPAQEGPGLMFLALPMAFSNMFAGRLVETLFFVLLLFAAWTSSINIAEPMVAMLCEKTSLTRKQVSCIVGGLAAVLGLVSVFSFNIWSTVRVFGRWDLFTTITDLSTNIFLPVGGIFYAIFAGWVMSRADTMDELQFKSDWIYQIWWWLTRFLAPIALLIVFIDAFT